MYSESKSAAHTELQKNLPNPHKTTSQA